MALRAVTFDYWDTLYDGATTPERVALRQGAVRRLLAEIGHEISDADFTALYRASGVEAERWWREEHRGYTTQERIRWILSRVNVERPADCRYVAAAERAVDDALVAHPAPLLPGAGDGIARLASAFSLAIVSDTGFASGRAQDRLLEHDGLLSFFAATVYSMDIGHAKPRPEPFAAALSALGIAPADAVHVGDNERTDVRGALALGLRAVRVDIVRAQGPSAAEFVARSFDELVDYLLAQRGV
ncbi:MAG: HAD family hydrolase [Gemmatimonadaceae bacterium]|nr:HAD family hydrolase [Gemmatimonadaceae bacterium]NUQ91574.1 HAD family hydrolase [Gemmatimonadaceae bacterium]NUR20636.1 HAD family hydrolase [Gemmatimonadaceae bacterium]